MRINLEMVGNGYIMETAEHGRLIFQNSSAVKTWLDRNMKPANITSTLKSNEVRLLYVPEGKVISTIKLVREFMGLSLKDAKDLVDKVRGNCGFAKESQIVKVHQNGTVEMLKDALSEIGCEVA